MFSNIGGKIKGLAIVLFILGCVAGVAGGIAMFVQGNVLGGILCLGCGFLGSWISSWGVYAFGELVDDTAVNRRYLSEIKASIDNLKTQPPQPVQAVQPKKESEESEKSEKSEKSETPAKRVTPPWKCRNCGAINPVTVQKCHQCGEPRSHDD